MKTDLELQRDVMEELKWEPFLNSTEIGVAVKRGCCSHSLLVTTYDLNQNNLIIHLKT